MNRKVLLLAVVVAILLGAALIWYRTISRISEEGAPPPVETPSSVPATPSETPVPAPSEAAPAPSVSPVSGRGAGDLRLAQGREASWREFQSRFGSDLKAEYAPDGRVASIQAAGNRPGVKDFDPKAPQKAIARAREILEAARDLIGVQGDSPLENPMAKGGGDSVQVSFQQTQGGVPIAPYGSVTLLLGASGELLRLDSTYVAPIQVMNDVRLRPDQARDLARAAVPSGGSSLKPEGGQRVIWTSIPSSAAGPVPARQAYAYDVEGRQVVVDASDGKILFKRDRRNF